MSPITDQDSLLVIIRDTAYRNIVGSPFSSSTLGRPQYINRAFGGNSATLKLLIAEGDTLPASEQHVSLIQNFSTGSFAQTQLKLFGGITGDITDERINDNFLSIDIPCVGYDSFLRGEKVVRINTKRLNQSPMTVTAAMQLALDQGGLSSGSPKSLDLDVTGDDGTLFDFQITELCTVEQALNEITQPNGFFWIVNPGNFLFRSELSGGSPPNAIATVLVFRRDSLPASPIGELSMDAGAWSAQRFSGFKYTHGVMLPTFIEIGSDVDTLEAQISPAMLSTDHDILIYEADSLLTVTEPLLVDTNRVSLLRAIPDTGSPVPLSIQTEPYSEGEDFSGGTVDSALDIGLKVGDPKRFRFRQAVGLFTPGVAGRIRATEEKWHYYGSFADSARETERLASLVGGTGRSADRAVVGELADDAEATAVALALGNSRQDRIRGAEFKTTENGVYPLQEVLITHTARGFTNRPAVITEVSYNAIENPTPVNLAAGKIFEVSAKCALFEPDSAEMTTAKTLAKTGTIDPPKQIPTGAAPQSMMCNYKILTTIAGNGDLGTTGDGGSALAAELDSPYGVALDSTGKIYISEGLAGGGVRVVDAGNIDLLYSAADAGISYPAIAVDPTDDFVFAAQFDVGASESKILRIDPGTGTPSTYAGTTAGYSGDGGAATAAEINNPFGICFDPAGNLYIADTFNHRVRKVAVGTGIITTVAGIGSAAFSGDGGAATAAELYFPTDVDIDKDGNLLIADFLNNRVRKVNLITDGFINTVAGNGTAGTTGDGGAALSAQINHPRTLASDATGNYFFTDGDGRMRAVRADATIHTILPAPTLDAPLGLSIDPNGDTLYVACSGNTFGNRVKSFSCFPDSPAPSPCVDAGDIVIGGSSTCVGVLPMDKTNVIDTADPNVFLNECQKDIDIDLSSFALAGGEERLLIPLSGNLSITDPVGTVGIPCIASVRAEIAGDVIFADFLSQTTLGNVNEMFMKSFAFVIDATSRIGSSFTVNFFVSGQITRGPGPEESIDAIIDVILDPLVSGDILCAMPQV